jgi:hypothetical protein
LAVGCGEILGLYSFEISGFADDPLALGLTGLTEQLIQNQFFESAKGKSADPVN